MAISLTPVFVLKFTSNRVTYENRKRLTNSELGFIQMGRLRKEEEERRKMVTESESIYVRRHLPLLFYLLWK